MKYPKLVPPKLCTANVRVVFLGGMDIEGREETLYEYSGKCNLLLKTKQTMTADKRLVTIEAVALFDGDIAPWISHPKGELYFEELFPIACEDGLPLEAEDGQLLVHTAEGKPYRIFRCTKERNPDGTVNYTRLELV